MFGNKYRYKNAISIENMTQVLLVSGMEGADIFDRENLQRTFDARQSIRMVLQKPRRYWDAVRISMRYSKLGIFNCIICINENPQDNFKD